MIASDSAGRERRGREAGHRPDLERGADDDQDARLAGEPLGARERVDGRSSPNITTPGLRIAPHAGTAGASRSRAARGRRRAARAAPHARQSTPRIDPCTSTTSALPGPCVQRVDVLRDDGADVARALERGERQVAGVRLGGEEPVGSAAPYQRQTRSGSRRNASIDATSNGSTSAQIPLAERKSGIPLSVLIPAP